MTKKKVSKKEEREFLEYLYDKGGKIRSLDATNRETEIINQLHVKGFVQRFPQEGTNFYKAVSMNETGKDHLFKLQKDLVEEQDIKIRQKELDLREAQHKLDEARYDIEKDNKKILVNQSKMLTATFWIYLTMAVVMWSQLFVIFFDSQMKVTQYSFWITALAVILTFLIILIAVNQLDVAVKKSYIHYLLAIGWLIFVFLIFYGGMKDKFEVNLAADPISDISNEYAEMVVENEPYSEEIDQASISKNDVNNTKPSENSSVKQIS